MFNNEYNPYFMQPQMQRLQQMEQQYSQQYSRPQRKEWLTPSTLTT